MAFKSEILAKAQALAHQGFTGMDIAKNLNLKDHQGYYLRNKFAPENMSAQDKAWVTRKANGNKEKTYEKKVSQTTFMEVKVSGNTITWSPNYKCVVKLNEDGSILIIPPNK